MTGYPGTISTPMHIHYRFETENDFISTPSPRIPVHLRSFLHPPYHANYYHGQNGGQLVQQLQAGACYISLHHFIILQTVKLRTCSGRQQPQLLLMFKGSSRLCYSEAAGQRMEQGYMFALDLRAHLLYETEFPPGQYTLLHIGWPADLTADWAANMSPGDTGHVENPILWQTPLDLKAMLLVDELLKPPIMPISLHRYIEEKITALLRHFIKSRDEPAKLPTINIPLRAEKLLKARSLIDRSRSQRLPMKEIMQRCQLNKQQLQEGFHEMFGSSVYQYQLQERLKHALRLLRTRQYTNKELARETGFSSATHFVRTFEKVFGMPPADWPDTTVQE